MLLQAVKIALEVKKYLIDNDQFDVSQVKNTRIDYFRRQPAVMTCGLLPTGES